MATELSVGVFRQSVGERQSEFRQPDLSSVGFLVPPRASDTGPCHKARCQAGHTAGLMHKDSAGWQRSPPLV